MNRYTFSTQTGKAYYCNSIPGFIADRSTDIVGRLIRHAFDINKEQTIFYKGIMPSETGFRFSSGL